MHENTTASLASCDNHLGFLDGIRGAAALYVMLAHCMIWGGWYWKQLPNPKVAVDVFMILSGFLMVFQYRNRESGEPIESWRTATRFWVRRLFRIAPVYYLMLIVVYMSWDAFIQGLAVLQQASPEFWQKPSIYDPTNYHMDSMNVVVHATFLFGLMPKYAFSNMTPDWSIGLEMQFYAAFPLLYLVLRRFSWVCFLLLSLTLSIVCNHLFARLPGVISGTDGLFPEPSFLLMKLPLFVIGMLACEVFCLHRQSPGKCALMTLAAMLMAARYSIVVSVVTGIILWLGWCRSAGKGSAPEWVKQKLNVMLGNRCAQFFADCSYSVYLMHGLLISFLGGGFLFVHPEFLVLSPPLRVGILMAAVCPGAYLVAWLLHHTLEKPGIELGRWVINRYLPLGTRRV